MRANLQVDQFGIMYFPKHMLPLRGKSTILHNKNLAGSHELEALF